MNSIADFDYFPTPLGDGLSVDLALPASTTDPVVLAYKKGIALNQYLVDWIKLFSSPGDYVLDLGCHVGTMSVPAAALGRHVLGVDASALHVEMVRASGLRNGLRSLAVMRCAVADRDGTIAFHENGLWGTVMRDAPSPGSPLVPAYRVESILKNAGWERLNLVKMDVEGSELVALQGLTRFLGSPGAPVVIYESNGMTFEQFGYSIADVRNFLEGFAFRTFRVEGQRLVHCRPNELQPEAWIDVVALPPRWQESLRERIDEQWSDEALVGRCLEWGRSEHRNVRQYLLDALRSGVDFPRHDPRLVELESQIAASLVGSATQRE